MPIRFNRCQASTSALLVFVLLAALLATSGQIAQARQGTNTPSPVDLAAVPLHPSNLPEPGFQLAQAGDLELGAVQAAWSIEGVDHEAWGPIGRSYRHGHSAVHVLLGDRADSRSGALASVTTFVFGFDSPEAAADAGPALLEIAGYAPTEDVDGVTVYADVDGLLGMRAEGDYLVVVQYAFPEQQNSTRQNTEDWTPESITSLVDATGDRLREAIDQAAEGVASLGVANVMFYGMQSPWTLPWIYYPSTEHYRVLNGEAVAYGGELAADLDDAGPAGIEELFVSRQQLGDEGYGHLIDVSLARFGSEAEADVFADGPAPITFPPTWIFNPAYTSDGTLPGGATVERVQVDDNLRASGYRTVRREGTTVQVVQWLASGNAVVSRDAIAWLTDAQESCLAALPEPCAPRFQDEIPAALSEGYADNLRERDAGATPVSGTPEAGVVASEQFGWEVTLPDDGWELTDTETFTNSEYFEFQSGRSLITLESVLDHHGDPQQCVLDNLALLETLEERAVIDIGSDDPAERAAGLEPDHGWAVYTVEPLQQERADQEYTIRYDCYTLVPGDASLVVTHTAPRDLWTGERDKGERFRDGIRLPASSANTHAKPPEGDGRFLGRTLTMGIPRIWIPLAA